MKEGSIMIKNAKQILESNYDLLGDLSDDQFIAAKARACEKKLIHAEQIADVVKISGGSTQNVSFNDVEKGDTIRLKATVRSMVGGVEKTGYVTLKNIQDIHHDDYAGMLIIDADGLIFTTLDCKEAVQQLNAVIRSDNWVTQQSLSNLLSEDSILKDFQQIRDGAHELDLDDIVLDEPQTPDLMF